MGRSAQDRHTFLRDGLISLNGVVDIAAVQAAYQGFIERYAGLGEEELRAVGSRVGHERYMISVDWAPPFDDPCLWANPRFERLLNDLLGPNFTLDSYALVAAYPGAAPQHVHLDHPLLFEGAVLSRALPPYAVTLAIPLIDLTPSSGGTRVWPGSHRRLPGFIARRVGGEVLLPPRGGAYLMDYRLLHGGTANHSALPRPILYLAYSRPWFHDAANFQKHPPLRITEAQRAALPPRLQRRIPLSLK
ncbi:MAG: phytanoyl-CoA dioxygenase family protein [Myxococcota bacterium]